MIFSALFSQENKVRVTAESASIYAKPNIKSYVIETVKKETILNLFQSQKLSQVWYYISLHSEKRKAYISGFVKVTAVAKIENFKKKSKNIRAKLKKEEKKLKINPLLKKEIIATKKFKKEEPKIKRPFKKKGTKPLPTRIGNIQNTSKTNKVIVTAESASIYAKSNIKSYVIETVKKETVLNLFQSQKLSRIWYYVSYYSEKRRAYLSGFVKVTAVEIIDHIQKKPATIEKELKKRGKSAISPAIIKQLGNPRQIQNKKKEIRQKEMLSTTPLALKTAASFQKSAMRQEKLEEKIIKTAFPTKEVVAFQKITEPPLEIKIEEMPSLNPPPTFVITAFKKTKEEPEKIKEGQKFSSFLLPKKEAPYSKKLIETQKEPKAKKPLNTTSPIREIKTSQNRKEGKRPKEKLPIATKIRPVPAKSKAVPKTLYAKKVKVTAESANIYAKPDIKSQVIETFKKETILNLSRTQKKPKIWNNITLYSEKRKAYISGFVKVTAVAKVDHFQKESKEIKEKLKKEEKVLNSAFPTKEVEASSNLKKEQNQIKKPHEEAEIKPMPTLPKKRISKGKFRLITLGIGYGQSYGGAGGFIQLNTKARLSLHGGIGYFPAYLFYSESDWVRGTMLYSGGLKYYLPLGSDPLNFYLDLQFCGIGVEAAHVFSGSFYFGPLFNNVQKTLWGPSFLAGIEVKMGRLGLNGAFGVSYNITKADWLEQNIFLTFDLGLLLYF